MKKYNVWVFPTYPNAPEKLKKYKQGKKNKLLLIKTYAIDSPIQNEKNPISGKDKFKLMLSWESQI